MPYGRSAYGRVPYARFVQPASGSSSPNINLTGVSATGVLGSFTPQIDSFGPLGVSATGALGSFTPQINFVPSGISATSAFGSFTPQVDSFGPSGITATSAFGVFGIQVNENFGGQSGTGQVTGPGAQLNVGFTAVSGTGSITGFSDTISSNVSLHGVFGTGGVGIFTIPGSVVVIPWSGFTANMGRMMTRRG